MNHIDNFNLFIKEGVNFFEKGKFWTINGKKVKVVSNIPQNPQVLKIQEVDKDGNPIGGVFVGKKGDIKGFKETIQPKETGNSEINKLKVEKTTEPESEKKSTGSEANTDVNNRYKELIQSWKENQKKNGKNPSPGEGTRKRLMKQAESEVNFDETTDVDADLKSLKNRPAFDAVDRISSLIKAKKIKNTNNILRYLDFTKSKIETGNVSRISPN